MSKLILAIALVLSAAPAAATEEPMGLGSCYEVKPICMQGSPICLCDRLMNCFWACR